MGAMKAIYTQLQVWGIDPETATDEDISAAFNVCFTLLQEWGVGIGCQTPMLRYDHEQNTQERSLSAATQSPLRTPPFQRSGNTQDRQDLHTQDQTQEGLGVMAHEIKARAKAQKPWHSKKSPIACNRCGGEVGDNFFIDLNNLSQRFVCTKCAQK